MTKSLFDKIHHKLKYLSINCDVSKYSDEITEIEQTVSKITHDDLRTLCLLMSRGLDNIKYRWQTGKTLHSASLARFILHYGDEIGTAKYQQTNLKKRAGLPNTIEYWTNTGLSYEAAMIKVCEVQSQRSKKSPASKVGSKFSVRSVEYWISKGLTLTAASEQVRKIQVTNGLPYYINKYGEDRGPALFNERIRSWQESRKSNPNYSNSCYMQGHGLAQYQLRYGALAVEKWKLYKTKFAKRGSKESEVAFAPLLTWLKESNIDYNFGPHNSEYIIVAKEKAWFFDLAIPSLNIIIEYHGEGFHPNPALTADEWARWKNPFSKEGADIQYKRDLFKKQLAEQHGFTYLEVYSSERQTRIPELFSFIKSAKSSSDNSTSTS